MKADDTHQATRSPAAHLPPSLPTVRHAEWFGRYSFRNKLTCAIVVCATHGVKRAFPCFFPLFAGKLQQIDARQLLVIHWQARFSSQEVQNQPAFFITR